MYKLFLTQTHFNLFVTYLYLQTEKSYFETRKKLDEWMVVLMTVGWSFSFSFPQWFFQSTMK
jgi:hypothetical protein